jgi:chemotaxis protein methyltransferase WspC
MSLKTIKELLKTTIGLNVSTVGVSNFERAVRQRMKVLNLGDVNVYASRLLSGEELRELIDEVIVPETWFFRNPASFAALQDFITNTWKGKLLGRKLMVMSVPCSTGEEPYSIAIALEQAGMQPVEFQIDAFDVSQRLLTKAKRGVYGRHSFRNKDDDVREKYFDLVGGTFVLTDRIRNAVNFQHGNILDKYFGINAQTYDVIFCRNLLIYFDRATQELAMAKLHRMLNDSGMLLIGHAEAPEFLRNNFARADYPRAFAFTKLADPVVADSRPAKSLTELMGDAPTPAARGKARPEFMKTVEMNRADTIPQTDAQVLREAARLANRGELREAGTLCETYLRENPTSAQAYYLLGLVRESEGKHTIAGELFKKAVYLDPNHYEAMIHLALHLARYGDAESAKKLQARAHRVLGRKKT